MPIDAEATDAVVVRELNSVDDPAFYDAMELYVETFPRNERLPVRRFASMLAEGAAGRTDPLVRSHLFVAEDADGLAGMRFSTYYKLAGLGYFVYIAVLKGKRKSGIGQMLVRTAQAQCRVDAVATGGELDAIFFECERPELAEGEERAWREKRLAFFEKRGGVIVSRTYSQPALSETYEPVPLYLLAYPEKEDIDWRKAATDYCRICLSLPAESEIELETLRGIA